MSYAAIAKKDAPPSFAQPHPDASLLTTHEDAVRDQENEARKTQFESHGNVNIVEHDAGEALLAQQRAEATRSPPLDAARQTVSDAQRSTKRAEQDVRAGAGQLESDAHATAQRGEQDLKAGADKAEKNVRQAAQQGEQNLKAGADKVEKNVRQAAQQGEQNLKAGADKLEKNVRQADEQAAEAIRRNANKAGEKAEELEGKAKDLYEDGKSEAKKLGNKVDRETQGIQKDVKAAGDKASKKAREVEREGRELAKKYPVAATGLIGAVNLAIIAAVGVSAYQNWNYRWDRRTVTFLTVGLTGLFLGEGYLGYYEYEQDKKGPSFPRA